MSTDTWLRAALLAFAVAVTSGAARADTFSFTDTLLTPTVSTGPVLYMSGSFTFEPNFTRQAPVLSADFNTLEAVDFQIFESGKLIRSLTDPSSFIYTDGLSNAGLGYIFGLSPSSNLDPLQDQLYLSYVPAFDGPTEVIFASASFSGAYQGNPSLQITAAVPEPSSLAIILGGFGFAVAAMLLKQRRV